MDNALKYRLVEKIIQLQDERLLQEVQTLLGLSDQDYWQELPNEVKQAINQAKAELDRGEGYTHEEVQAYVRRHFLQK
jgi:hypothetical protein